MLNEANITLKEYDCLGFRFEPLGVIRLEHWHVKEKADGSVDSYTVRALDPVISDSLLVNPTTLKIAASNDVDPAAVPAFTYVRDTMFGSVKGAVEGFVVANNLIGGGAQ